MADLLVSDYSMKGGGGRVGRRERDWGTEDGVVSRGGDTLWLDLRVYGISFPEKRQLHLLSEPPNWLMFPSHCEGVGEGEGGLTGALSHPLCPRLKKRRVSHTEKDMTDWMTEGWNEIKSNIAINWINQLKVTDHSNQNQSEEIIPEAGYTHTDNRTRFKHLFSSPTIILSNFLGVMSDFFFSCHCLLENYYHHHTERLSCGVGCVNCDVFFLPNLLANQTLVNDQFNIYFSKSRKRPVARGKRREFATAVCCSY